MRRPVAAWMPGVMMALGAVFTVGINRQASAPLRAELDVVVPEVLAGFDGRNLVLSDAERDAVGVDAYLLREYGTSPDSVTPFALSLYIGYYEQQTQGRTIHSPKNCLPGSGWEALASTAATLALPAGDSVTVNRYIIQRESEQALVLYWYQGRGRVAANEYRVKWDLLRDAALSGRTEEALVRLVVPITSTEEAAFQLATEAAAEIVPSLARALPQ